MIKLSNFEKVKDNVHVGTMTFKDYLLFAKEKVNHELGESITQSAELKAMEYNQNIESNDIFPMLSVNVFCIESENSLIIFDAFITKMIFNLEERFMDNKLIINFYEVPSLEKARQIFIR